jgi:hypothetical protein
MVSTRFDLLSFTELKICSLKIVHKGFQKKHNFALISKRCITLASRSDPKKFPFKTFFAKNLFLCECLDWQYSQFINIVGKDDVNPAAPNFKQGEVA